MGLGYWVVPSARGQAFGTRAARLATSWALSELEVVRVEALVDPDNVASQRLLMAAGFRRETIARSCSPVDERTADAIVFARTQADA